MEACDDHGMWRVVLMLVAACGGDDVASVSDAPPDGPCLASDACLKQDLDEMCQQVHVLGAVIVVRTPTVRYRATCGFADIAQQRPLVPTDRFRVGSITKLFTAALALDLVDEDLLTLDTTPASQSVDIDNGGTIMLRDLLGHTSGLVEYNSEPTFDWSRAWTIPEVIEWVRTNHEPLYAPKTGFTYSGTGFQVAAAMIGAGGRPAYPVALRQRILAPLHLDSTYLDGAETLPGGKVDGAKRSGGAFAPRDFADDWASADGSLVTTADDLVTWGEHLFLARDVVSASSVDAMLAPTKLANGTTPQFLGGPYGLGVEILEGAAGGPIYGHGGLDFGFAAYVGVQPATGRAVAVVINTDGVDPRTFANVGWLLLAR